MPESDEHKFIKKCITDALYNFSKTKLYEYSEADRNKFDFACTLECDWSRPLVGQVLWRNRRGIEKDIRTLINDSDSDIKVYAISTTLSHESAFIEVMNDYKKSDRYPDLFKVRPIRIPENIDLDKDIDRKNVNEIIRSQIVDDILFNIVFGRLTPEDLNLLLTAGNNCCIEIALLYKIATNNFSSLASLSRSMRTSSTPIRESLPFLVGLGFLESSPFSAKYKVSLKGRVLLDLFRQIYQSFEHLKFSEELLFIMDKLDCVPQKSTTELQFDLENRRGYIYPQIVISLMRAASMWDCDFLNFSHNGSLTVEIK